MKRVMVRYQVKPERLDEHERLVRAVFAALQAKAPAGIRYAAFKHDERSFVHVAFVEAEDSPLQALEAFQAFTKEIRDRCDVPPAAVDLTEIGVYGV